MSPVDAVKGAAGRAATGARTAVNRTFRSLYVRNYRLYFVGQGVSMAGSWMQSVAQAWLILQLTGSGLALGLTTALQFGPILVLGPWGGVLADRRDKRRLLIATQSAFAALALAMGLLTVTGVVEPWMVYALAGCLGLVTSVDNPARQSFVIEMVGREDLPNAISLNSVLLNGARVVGPAVAGVLIATVGTGLCFLINAASYVAVIVALGMMRAVDLHVAERAARAKGQLREGLRYVARNPGLRRPLLLMLAVGALGFNFATLLPLFATGSLHAGAGGYGALFSLMGVGAVAGGLAVAFRGRVTNRMLVASAAGFGASLALLGVMPDLKLALLAMLPCGVANTVFISTSNSLLQEHAAPSMRGRVMALFGVVFLGTTPIGAPLAGWVAESLGPRAALALAGLAVMSAAIATAVAFRRASRTRTALGGATEPLRALDPAPQES